MTREDTEDPIGFATPAFAGCALLEVAYTLQTL